MLDPRDLPEDVTNILADILAESGYQLVDASDYEFTDDELIQALSQLEGNE